MKGTTMRLGELRGAIRKTKGNPIVRVPLADGRVMTLSLQKTPLLEELERLFPGGKGTETPFEFHEASGVLSLPIGMARMAVDLNIGSVAAETLVSNSILLDQIRVDDGLLDLDEPSAAPAPATDLDDLLV